MQAKAEQQRRLDILVVEDNPPDVVLLQSTCPDIFSLHAVHVVNDGEAALNFMEQRGPFVTAPRPHLIILDINIPRVDGIEVLTALKANPALRSIPVIVFTTARAGDLIARAYARGANAVMSKPDNLDGYEEICKALDQYWLRMVLPPNLERAEA